MPRQMAKDGQKSHDHRSLSARHRTVSADQGSLRPQGSDKDRKNGEMEAQHFFAPAVPDMSSADNNGHAVDPAQPPADVDRAAQPLDAFAEPINTKAARRAK